MSMWFIAAMAMLVCLVPCAVVAFRGDAVNRLTGLEAANSIVILTFMMLAEGFKRTFFFDLPLTLALLALGGALVFTRFIERWM